MSVRSVAVCFAAACCCRRQVVLTPKRVKELQTWVAFHRKHQSLDMPLDMGTECATIEEVSFLGVEFCVELGVLICGVSCMAPLDHAHLQPPEFCVGRQNMRDLNGFLPFLQCLSYQEMPPKLFCFMSRSLSRTHEVGRTLDVGIPRWARRVVLALSALRVYPLAVPSRAAHFLMLNPVILPSAPLTRAIFLLLPCEHAGGEGSRALAGIDVGAGDTARLPRECECPAPRALAARAVSQPRRDEDGEERLVGILANLRNVWPTGFFCFRLAPKACAHALWPISCFFFSSL